MSADARELQLPGALERAAHELAAGHVVASGAPRVVPPLAALDTLPAWLTRAEEAFAAPEGAAAKAAEWLLDNAYVVRRAVRQVREDMPGGFYARLRPLATGDLARAPRVYALARALLRSTDAQLTPEAIARFVNAYQEATAALDIAELWAFPTMLRLACLELLVTAVARLTPTVAAPFTADACAPALDDAECVARAVRGLVTVAALPWKDFFRRTSAVERVLEEDPPRVYAQMDFDTCDRYRKVVEELAHRAGRSEVEVARCAIAAARRAEDTDSRRAHVGYWLIDDGRLSLEATLGYRPRVRERCRRRMRRYAGTLYASALLCATLMAAALPAAYLHAEGAGLLGWIGGMLLVMLPASALAITAVHAVVTSLVRPDALPKLAFEEGIPSAWKTAVVIPTLLGRGADVARLIRQLERHYLANPDPTLQFVLLTDFTDAEAAHMPGDDALVEAAIGGIRELNARHGAAAARPFHLLHRERRYDAAEGCWMGWERKRGKLEEFNHVLAGDGRASYVVREGDPAGLAGVRFVITLDSDTLLPQGAATRLVGILAHPLNRPEFDAASGRVRSGYTIIQPRIAISPDSGNRSRFARLYSGDTSVDIYSRAVSDVYQDLFGTGTYVGKGIYDVDAFRRSLADRVPEHAIASHDLFEGAHGRVALATDVIFYEEYPSQYLAYARRLHRWMRGDWQLVPWLRRRVSTARGMAVNPIGAIDRWKIVDNLRRTLLSPARLLFLIAGWLWLPGNAAIWTVLAVLAPADTFVSDVGTTVFRGRRGTSARAVLAGVVGRVHDHAARWLLSIVFLPHEAMVTTDAILRTVVRVAITRRHLLQWAPAAETGVLLADHPRALVWYEMGGAPTLAVALAIVTAAWRPAALVSAVPLLVLWFLSPEIALRLSAPSRSRTERLTPEDRTFVRSLARRTWLFFETFVGPDDQWLPPDNYQEHPIGEVAHRTSPTNVGMMFLSTFAAWDLGYLGVGDLGFRLRSSLETLQRLERHRGHLLNWYDTRTLEALRPRYVSTVDSGNLAASMMAMRQGCLEACGSAVLRSQRWDGLADTARLLAAAVERFGDAPLGARAHHIETRARQVRDDPAQWAATIDDLCVRECVELDHMLVETVKMLEARSGPLDMVGLRELRIWFERVQHHVRGMHDEVATLVPWLPLLGAPPAGSAPDLVTLLQEVRALLPATLRLDAMHDACARARAMVALARARTRLGPPAEGDDGGRWLAALQHSLELAAKNATAVRAELLDVVAKADTLVADMDFRLVYDRTKQLLHIGYNVDADRLDPHHYDLLASEARIASLVAIAKGDLPVAHWFALGRAVTRTQHTLALLSWGGSMFEYLMPPLLLHSHEGTLLAQSQRAAVDAQIAWGARRAVPWGVSESGYAVVNADQHYQYRAFGIAGLGLRRESEDPVVVAPYATALALPFRPRAAVENLRRLRQLGMIGTYGCYEALDFTPAHLPPGRHSAVVRSYMAHHQGMLVAALDNYLREHVFVRRFHADSRVHAAELLLHERVPPDLPAETAHDAGHGPRPRREPVATPQPWTPRRGSFPAAHVLGNGRLSCVVTESGAGVLRWQRHALTRGAFDPTCDDTGLWIYVRDEESGALWSAGRQPTGAEPDEYAVLFHAHMAEFHRRDHGIALRMEIAVSATDDVEIRYLTLQNESARPRRLTLTSYGEVVLAPAADDERHPAFSKLFVSGEYLRAHDALLFTRRPRRADEHPPVLMHRVLVDGAATRLTGFETDRARFLGRNAGVRRPSALGASLSATVGTTLDTIMSTQVTVDLEPRETAHLAFVTVVGGSRESVLETADRFATLTAVEWTLGDAAAEASRELRHVGIDPGRLPEMESLLSILLYAPPVLRCAADAIATNRLGQPRLWAMGASGDVPILLVRIADEKETALVEDLVRAHHLWRRRGVAIDLVLLWEGASGYEDTVSGRVLGLLRSLGVHDALGGRGGIHLVRADQVTREERQLLEAAAHAVLTAGERSLAQQLADGRTEPQYPPAFVPTERVAPNESALGIARPTDLRFDNGIGGFAADGREYVIWLAPGERTPAPWSNVLANREFGTLVTEAGGGYTWSLNSAEHRLTPWRNDPVGDAPAEALYLRDEETAQVWTPTPRPAGGDAACEVRHGAGYTTWARGSHGLEQALTVFVPPEDPVKILRLRLANRAARPRRITVTYYAEWILGTTASTARPFVVTEYDATNAALLARSAWNPDFAERVAFVASDRSPHGFTTDRREFIGREGDLTRPAALSRWGLSSTTPPGCDPCAALQVHVALRPGEQTDVLFVLGDARDRAHAEHLLRRWRDPRTAERAWDALRAHWDGLLGAVTVRTPEPALDVMLNRWLLYQAISARILARTGLYQSSGAFGFRDQLQDVMALVHVEPSLARAHIVACAERQFEEGDVLHWWHPPADRGVRTRCSDDLLWLPYVAAYYVETTGDAAILDEPATFLDAPPLAPGEHDRYGHFDATATRASLFEHCRRALARGITLGAHGLPLIGTGDWNDALDRVGAAGRGESVWLAWFAVATMRAFAELCDRRDEREDASHWRGRAKTLAAAVEREAWDGEWYQRAYDDDGRPWGSAASGECAIDSITQSWAALSGAGADDRIEAALRAAERALVSPQDRIVRLLWPPFDLTMRDPGYIKAYPPGIRENGGQYTHAAAWLGWAFAATGDGDRAAAILRIINPITHAATRDDALLYRVEPYVIAADVGGAPPHVGRGGWTWYTGAAAWTWRLGIEAILGLRRTGGRLQIDPCIPREWPGFSATVRAPRGSLEIEVDNPDHVSRGVAEISVDGIAISGKTLDLPNDGAVHRVRVRLGIGGTGVRAAMTAS